MIIRSICVMACYLLISGCATTLPVEPPSQAQISELLSLFPEAKHEPVKLLSISKPMQEFVNQYVNIELGPRRRLQNLFDALSQYPENAVQYKTTAHLTATEAFRQKEANCLAFSAMFISLAREAGLRASFQEVDLPPEWDSFSDNTLVQYRHVNVTISLPGEPEIVDFRMDRYSETFPKRKISDQQALAHYYSNISTNYLATEEFQEAYINARAALKAYPEQPFIWNNMGIILSRLDRLDLAETSFRQALTLDPDDGSALTNLANVYRQQDREDLFEKYIELGNSSKLRNPYYRYALAQNAYNKKEYDEALKHLDQALEKYKLEHRFYFLRGLSLWHTGKRNAAMKNVRQAMRMARGSSASSRYSIQLKRWEQELEALDRADEESLHTTENNNGGIAAVELSDSISLSARVDQEFHVKHQRHQKTW